MMSCLIRNNSVCPLVLEFPIQSNFNGLNTFGTIICWRQGRLRQCGFLIEPGQEAKYGQLFDFLKDKSMLCVLIIIASSR